MTWSVSNESAPVRRAPAKRARACPTESQEQKSLFKWWRVYSRHAPHLVMYHIPNGGRRDAITGARLKAEGVVAGVPDIFLAERYLLPIIDDQAGNAHHLILLPQVWEAVQVIDLGGDVRIFRSDPLSRRHQLRAHGTGEGDQKL